MADHEPEEHDDQNATNEKTPKDMSFERMLKNTRRKVSKRKDEAQKKASGRVSDIGFWSVVAGVSFVADWAFLGGLGTAAAALTGVSWMNHKSTESKANKEIEELDRKLMELEELKALSPEPQQPRRKMKEDFSKATVEELRKKLEDVQRELDNLKDPKGPELDKPKFGPPRL